MNRATLGALVAAGAIRQVCIIADGSTVYIEITTQVGEASTITTNRGSVKCWITIDAAAKWVKSLGIGKTQLEIGGWLPGQKSMQL